MWTARHPTALIKMIAEYRRFHSVASFDHCVYLDMPSSGLDIYSRWSSLYLLAVSSSLKKRLTSGDWSPLTTRWFFDNKASMQKDFLGGMFVWYGATALAKLCWYPPTAASAANPLRCSAGGDIVRGDADDGDIELACCDAIVVCSTVLCGTFGECISLDRNVFEPGDICIEKMFANLSSIARSVWMKLIWFLMFSLKL